MIGGRSELDSHESVCHHIASSTDGRTMARSPTNTEFLRKLRELSGAKTQAQFALICGRNTGAMNQYLTGSSVPGDRVLKLCLENYAQKSVSAPSFQKEVELQEIKGYAFPRKPGVYVIFDSSAKVLYIGQATNFST